MEVAISKRLLPELAACKGMADADTNKLFVGFSGRLDVATGLYVGRLNFTDVPEDFDGDYCSIKEIIGGQDDGDS